MDDFTAAKRLETMARAYRKSFSLFAAAEIGLFDVLSDKYTLYNDTAEELNVSAHRLKALLDLLCYYGLLLKESDNYKIHHDYIALADNNRKDNITARLAHPQRTAKSWHYLVDILKEDKPSSALKQRPKRTDKDIIAFHRSLGSRGEKQIEHYISQIPLKDSTRLMDVGGGFGDLCLPFLKSKKISHATVLETSDTARLATLSMTDDIFADCFTFYPCNFIYDQLPGGFELCLVSNILHIYSENTCLKLLSKLHKSLKDNGQIFIREITINDDATGPEAGLEFSLHMAINTESGKAHSENTVKRLLQMAGFSDIVSLQSPAETEYAVLARKKPGQTLPAESVIV